MQTRHFIFRLFSSTFWLAIQGGLIAAGLLFAAWLAWPSFNGLYGQDPYAYFDYAMDHALLADLVHFRPFPPFFWPPGYPLLVSLTALFAGPSPLAGQLPSLAMGILSAWATAMLAREIWHNKKKYPWQPLLAGLLVGFTGQLWQSSVVVMADTTGLAAATIGIWALVRYGRSTANREPQSQNPGASSGRETGWLLLSAAALAFAILARWGYALLTIPATFYYFWVTHWLGWKAFTLRTAYAILISGVVFTPLVISLLSMQPDTAKGPSLSFVGDLEVYSWNPGNALRRSFITTDGVLNYRFPNGLYYALIPAHPFFFTPLLSLFLLPGIWQVLHHRRDPQIALVAGWAGIIYLFHAGAPWQNFRFSLAYLPPLAIIATFGVSKIKELTTSKRPWYGSVVRGTLVVGLAWMAYGGKSLTTRFIERNLEELKTAGWVAEQLPPDAQLITFGITQTIRHTTPIDTYELFYQNPDKLADLLHIGRPTYLFLDLSVIQDQWKQMTPGLNYNWLVEENTLEVLGQYRDYTLFRVTGT